jgi:hypothetical protein
MLLPDLWGMMRALVMVHESNERKEEAIWRQRLDDLETDVKALRRETNKRRWIPR